MISLLCVDDEPNLLMLQKLFLERKGGFMVETAISASNALNLLKIKKFDAIVSDYQMPEMNGIEFLKQVRNNFGEIPFILFTGRGREEVVIEAINNGANFYIQKGGDPESQFVELIHHIEQAVHRQRIEERTKCLEKREADIINFLPDLTFAIDIKGKVIAWSKSIEKVTGINAQQILGKNNYEYSIPFYHKRRPVLIDLVLKPDPVYEAKYKHLLRRDDVLMTEIWCPHLDNGKGMHFWVMAAPLYDTDGNLSGAIESLRDITNRKKNEEVIRKSEAQYRAVFEYTDAATLILEKDTTISLANQAYADLSGFPLEEIINKKKWTEFVALDDLERMQEYHRLRRMNGGLAPESYEFKFIGKNGKKKHVLAHIGMIQNSSQSVASLLDISFRKQYETDLQQKNDALEAAYSQLAAQEEALIIQINELNEHKLIIQKTSREMEEIIDFLPDATFAINANHEVTAWNKAMEQLMGINRSEILGKTDYSCLNRLYGLERPSLIDFALTNKRDARNFYPTVKEEGDMLIVDSIVAYPRGKKTILWLKARPFYDNHGNITGAIETIRDVTDYWLLQESLETANQKLNLLYSVTRHDIKNKITSVLGLLAIIKDEIKDPEPIRYLNMAHNLIKAIDEEIDFTKLYQNLGVDLTAWQDLGKIISRCHCKNIEIITNVENIEILADPMLYKVFLNLLDNTHRHSETATKIHLSKKMDGNHLKLIWEDNGVGIPDDQKEKIFLKGYGKNSGFGLYLVREILGITGMTIKETGKEGEGARFEIMVPERVFRLKDVSPMIISP
jgi:PAS domain S-box-containing protein